MAEEEFPCPECTEAGEQKVFTRAQGLAVHRAVVHGVPGATTKKGRRRRRRGAAVESNGAKRGVNRDGLLRTIFPDGIPPKEDVIRRTTAWLDEAEALVMKR